MMILAYVLNILGLISLLSASIIKGEKIQKTLFLVLCGNFLVATGYLCGGKGIIAAFTGYLATLQTGINFIFDAGNKSVPRWLVGIYALSFFILTFWVGGWNFLSVLSLLASMTFIMGILQKNGKGYRFWTLLNCIVWSLFDICSGAYNGLITHGIAFLFTLAGMILNDRNVE